MSISGAKGLIFFSIAFFKYPQYHLCSLCDDDYRMINKPNWTECGRKRLWPILKYYTVIVWTVSLNPECIRMYTPPPKKKGRSDST